MNPSINIRIQISAHSFAILLNNSPSWLSEAFAEEATRLRIGISISVPKDPQSIFTNGISHNTRVHLLDSRNMTRPVAVPCSSRIYSFSSTHFSFSFFLFILIYYCDVRVSEAGTVSCTLLLSHTCDFQAPNRRQ